MSSTTNSATNGGGGGGNGGSGGGGGNHNNNSNSNKDHHSNSTPKKSSNRRRGGGGGGGGGKGGNASSSNNATLANKSTTGNASQQQEGSSGSVASVTGGRSNRGGGRNRKQTQQQQQQGAGAAGASQSSDKAKAGGNKKKGNNNNNNNNNPNSGNNSSNTNNNNDPKTADANANKKKKSRQRRRNNKGKDSNNASNNSNNKSSSAKSNQRQQQPSAEELKLKQQREREEAEAKLKKEQQEKLEAIRLKAKQDHEEKITNACTQLFMNVIYPTKTREETREGLNPEALTNSRVAFQKQKKSLKSDLKKCTAFCKKIKSIQNWDLPSPILPSSLTGIGTPVPATTSVVTSMLNDVEKLNLTRYTEEIAAAFLETKIKVADIPGVVAVCVALHKRYNDFMDILLPSLLAPFKGSGSGSGSSSSDDIGKNKRVYFRILIEFAIVGILPDFKPVMKILSEAVGAPSSSTTTTTSSSPTSGGKNPNEYNVTDPMLVVSFAKASGHEITGVVPKTTKEYLSCLVEHMEQNQEQQKDDDDLSGEGGGGGGGGDDENNSATSEGKKGEEGNPTEEKVAEKKTTSNTEDDELKESPPTSSHLVPISKETIEKTQEAVTFQSTSTEVGERFHKHLMGAFQSLSTSYTVTNKKLMKLEKRCEQDRLLTGTLSEQREKGLNDARKLLETIKRSVEALAEALDEDVPEIVDEEEENAENMNEKTGLELYKGEDDGDTNLGPFDDEETRDFYCNIPDLLTTIPPALLGYSPEMVEKIKAENAQKYGSGFELLPEDSESLVNDGNAVSEEHSALEEDFQDEDVVADNEKGDAEVDDENKDAPHYKLTLLIDQELPECNRCDKIDQLAEKFCVNHGASKNSRKRLQRALFLVPRSRLDLLPYYSRLAAILDRVFPDIAMPLVTELEQQFHGLARWKKQQSIESRLRNARFLGELTKFRVAPPIVLLRGFKRCLDDFSGYNIDVACCVLESCGRYLHRTKHTFSRLTNLMDTMVRIRKARNLDERSIALINSAIYMVTPPQNTSRKVVKVLSPLEAYTKDLLLVRLDPNEKTVSLVSKQLLRYPWNSIETECSTLIVKYLMKACRRGRFDSITAVAAVVANLKKTKPEILARITDSILEELQHAMEKPSMHLQQRSLVYAKLLGELQSRALLAGSVIFDQLYQLINFGHDIPATLHQASVGNDSNESSSPSLSKTVLSIPKGASQTINEDEEMEEEEDDESRQESEVDEKPAPVAVSSLSKYDPRVPCLVDPPTAVFRIKLVCILLDSCASSLVTSANKTKIEKLLIAFQRYIFTKFTLPTDIEFSLLDTFDLLDSKLKSLESEGKRNSSTIRYNSWTQCHEATVNAEEMDAIADEKALKRLLSQAGVANVILGDGDGVNNDDLETNGIGFDDDDDSFMSLNTNDHSSLDDDVSESTKESIDEDSCSDASDALSLGDSNAEEGESDDDYEDDNEEEDDISFNDDELDEATAEEYRMRKLEEEAFEQELRRLTMDAVEKGKVAARTGSSAKVSDTMPTASHFIRNKNSVHTNTEKGSALALGGESGISFKLLKRGHKGRVEAKEFVVPSATNIAKMATKQDDEAAKERDILKARVLQYEAESAEQMYAGDVFGDQTRLPEVRNRPLLMEDIDRNFGRSSYRARPSNYSGRGGRGEGRLFDPGRGRPSRP